MKKIIAAGLKQIIEFDNIKEMYLYIGKLRSRKIEHKCISHTEAENGTVRLTIIKAYNNCELIEG